MPDNPGPKPSTIEDQAVSMYSLGQRWVLLLLSALVALSAGSWFSLQSWSIWEQRQKARQEEEKVAESFKDLRQRAIENAGHALAESAGKLLDEKERLERMPVAPERFQLIAATVDGSLLTSRDPSKASKLGVPDPDRVVFLLDSSTGRVWKYAAGYSELGGDHVPPFFSWVENVHLFPADWSHRQEMNKAVRKK